MQVARLLAIVLAVGIGACTRAPQRAISPESFYAWWDSVSSHTLDPAQAAAAAQTPSSGRPAGLEFELLPFKGLARTRALVPRPEESRSASFQVYDIPLSEADTARLWIPTDSLAPLDSDSDCRAGRSWLGVPPYTAWTALDFNPYCAETYGVDEADWGIFRLGAERYPHLDLTTNGPACIPSALYRYDASTGRYVLIREACAP